MQQQDNDFPLDQIQSGAPAAGNPPSNGGLAGGTTFQPQSDPQPSGATPPAPNWQQTASSDAAALYQQPENPVAPGPAATPAPTPENPVSGPELVVPNTESAQPPEAMQQDFSQASQIATPSAPLAPQPLAPDPTQPAAPTPMQTPQEPVVPMPEPGLSPAPALPETPPATPAAPMMGAEPSSPMPSNPLMAGTAPEPMAAPMSGLPGSDQLGPAAVGMDQPMSQPANSGLDPNLNGVDPLTANMDGMGAYGPPPKNNKKLLFIIGGAVLGLIIIGIVIFVISRSSARQPAQNLNPTTTTTPTEETQTTPTPTSGPATPPQGYVTIEKQCYTFALYDPNTVPADQACSFKDATFGKLKTSKISVISTTESYKNLDEFVNTIKPTLTVTSEESIKLDNFDAKQLIYKASDGKTYSRVLALIVGKSYQQDGKAVTGIDITTSYQDDFDKTVTKNVLDTWRWK